MPVAARIALVAAVLGLVCFGFLGVIAYQNAEAISTLHQRGVLKSIGQRIAADAETGGFATVDLSRYPLLGSPDLQAAILSPAGLVETRVTDADSADILDRVVETRAQWVNAPAYEHRIDRGDNRFVWHRQPLGADGAELILLHRCMKTPLPQITQLYIVPIGLAVLMVLWLSVWAGIMGQRMIRSRARERSLELEVLRHEETSKIKSSFLANMSHELRTPLNAIIGFSEMLKIRAFGPVGSKKNEEYVSLIGESGHHLLQIVDNLLDLSRIEAGAETLQDGRLAADALIGDSVAMIEPITTRRRQTVETRLIAGTQDILADRLKLKQVMLNLLSNASKFAPEGTAILVRVTTVNDGGLSIEVTDNGPGIAPEDLATVMQTFGRAVSGAELSKDGTGLGLPLSEALIRLHGGTLTLVSTPGEGTTARIWLPPERCLGRSAVAGEAA
ncbi:MAG: sensor histidine kinase [Minwuia sp.]|uniref:sensor histidine kinase n=1 Tax=Minwuia sp. TaxID=2493630 RepID=UPI003A83D777